MPNRVPAIFVAIRFDFLLSSLSLCLRFVTITQFPSTTDFHCFVFVCRDGLAGTRCNMEADGRRKLVRTSTSWAERHPQGVCRIRKAAEPPTAAQQRIIEAEANRLAVLTRQRRAMGSAIGKHCSSSSCSLAMGNAFLLDGHTARFLSRERKWGVWCCGVHAAYPPHLCGKAAAIW